MMTQRDKDNLKAIAKRAVAQGQHTAQIGEFLLILYTEFRKEFTEDNTPTAESFMTDALNEVMKLHASRTL